MQTRLYLTHEDHGRELSWDEFIGADFEEGYRYEMIEGRIEVSPAANMPHDTFGMWLLGCLSAYSLQNPNILQYLSTHARIFLPNGEERISVPEPDIACYAESAPDLYVIDIDWRDYSPIVVVEVISPDTADKDLIRNRRLYLQVPGIQEYWILDPREGVEGLTMFVYRRRGRRWAARLTVGPGETYTTEMLPGFSLVLNPHAT